MCFGGKMCFVVLSENVFCDFVGKMNFCGSGEKMYFYCFDGKLCVLRFGRRCVFVILAENTFFDFGGKMYYVVLVRKYVFTFFTRKYVLWF